MSFALSPSLSRHRVPASIAWRAVKDRSTQALTYLSQPQSVLTFPSLLQVEKMATIRVRAKQIIQAPLPPLDMGSQDYLFGTS
ncbi:hypothetical protein Pdw03_7929 [Penicillium digitatum]|uniref:Uncharacterized protein n=1 Tax=Penicillium digitatum TaxID=36651 RepID=A0A7T6XML0_PENDI|nr:hypothetical protein Pdw03_7929 [Penicillium digitatum]